MARRRSSPKTTPVAAGRIEIEDQNGNRVTVTEAHWRRWPSVRETFRPVAAPRNVGGQEENGEDPGEDGNPPGA